MKIGLAQIEIKAGHPEINVAKILQFIEQAKLQRLDLIIFPAMAVSGKLLGDTYMKKSFQRECEEFGQQIVSASNGIKIIFGNFDGGNSVIIAQDGKFSVEEWSPVINIDNICVAINSSAYTIGRNVERHKIYSAQAIKNNRPLIYVNNIGIQNTGKTVYTYDGNSAVYNSRGEVVMNVEPYVEALKVIDSDEIDNLPVLDSANDVEIADIYDALNFGVDKFLRQTGISKVVIGISGGIDSAVAAALYTKILGAENVYLVNMPSVFNSTTTRNLSEQLAKNLGCKYAVVTIQNSVDSTIRQIELTPVTFLSNNTTEQIKISGFVRENMQARDRSGRVLATIAAAVDGGFTCNANKAESTIGYATMYGDAAGFLAATADLWKFQIYALAHYLNDEVYGREVIPQGIIDIVPSAELSDAQNVDEGKGDPLHYDYHDYLFRAFVENFATPEDILNAYVAGNLESEIGCAEGLVNKYFVNAKDFIEDLERWWRQFQGIAIAKRIQSPPILAVSSRAFGSFSESQNGVHFTQAYLKFKQELLNKN